MTEKSKHWDEMEPRERDAWVAEQVMGWEWCGSHTDGLGLHLYSAEVAEGYAEGYRKLKTPSEVTWSDFRSPTHVGLIIPSMPNYSTDPAADYEVLNKVRGGRVFGFKQFRLFCFHVIQFSLDRSDLISRGDDESFSAYKPGDYSHAAWLTLNAEGDGDE